MLKVTNLQVNFGGIRAVKDISFEVNDGKIVALIGANGAGKSTTLRSIAGLEKISGNIIALYYYCEELDKDNINNNNNDNLPPTNPTSVNFSILK